MDLRNSLQQYLGLIIKKTFVLDFTMKQNSEMQSYARLVITSFEFKRPQEHWEALWSSESLYPTLGPYAHPGSSNYLCNREEPLNSLTS